MAKLIKHVVVTSPHAVSHFSTFTSRLKEARRSFFFRRIDISHYAQAVSGSGLYIFTPLECHINSGSLHQSRSWDEAKTPPSAIVLYHLNLKRLLLTTFTPQKGIRETRLYVWPGVCCTCALIGWFITPVGLTQHCAFSRPTSQTAGSFESPCAGTHLSSGPTLRRLGAERKKPN